MYWMLTKMKCNACTGHMFDFNKNKKIGKEVATNSPMRCSKEKHYNFYNTNQDTVYTV